MFIIPVSCQLIVHVFYDQNFGIYTLTAAAVKQYKG